MSEASAASPTSDSPNGRPNKLFLENLQNVMRRRNDQSEFLPGSRPLAISSETATSLKKTLNSENKSDSLWDDCGTKQLLDTKALQHRINVAKCRSHRRPTNMEAQNHSSRNALSQISDGNLSFEKSLSENEIKSIDQHGAENEPTDEPVKQEDRIVSKQEKSVELKRSVILMKRPVSLFAAKPTAFQLIHNEKTSSQFHVPQQASLLKQKTPDESSFENQLNSSVADIRRRFGNDPSKTSNSSHSAAVSDSSVPGIEPKQASTNPTTDKSPERLICEVNNATTDSMAAQNDSNKVDSKSRRKSVVELLQEFENRNQK